MTATGRVLSTAEERREVVLSTAVSSFAARGYYGTNTTEVAKRAGISQAYVYRLFPNKEALFVAVVERTFDLVRDSFARGAAKACGSESHEVLMAMGDEYARLIADPDLLLVQVHAQAAAASEPAVREVVRRSYARTVEYVRSVSGADADAVQYFMARGALCHLVVAIGATEVDAPWANTLSAGLRHY